MKNLEKSIDVMRYIAHLKGQKTKYMNRTKIQANEVITKRFLVVLLDCRRNKFKTLWKEHAYE